MRPRFDKFHNAPKPENLKARGQTAPGEMNKTELAYAERLEAMRQGGEIAWYAYESVKLRLAANTFYTADFMVMTADGSIEMHEVKGGVWQDDARVKIKVAASLYPFPFIAVQKLSKRDAAAAGTPWKVERF